MHTDQSHARLHSPCTTGGGATAPPPVTREKCAAKPAGSCSRPAHCSTALASTVRSRFSSRMPQIASSSHGGSGAGAGAPAAAAACAAAAAAAAAGSGMFRLRHSFTSAMNEARSARTAFSSGVSTAAAMGVMVGGGTAAAAAAAAAAAMPPAAPAPGGEDPVMKAPVAS